MSEKVIFWLIWFSGGAMSILMVAAFAAVGFLLSGLIIQNVGTWLNVPQPVRWDTLAWIGGGAFGSCLVLAVFARGLPQ